ncbi:LysM peptidoglycan-binding domain-containing protein [Peribacillus alkalitolerans]|uniref:C40 family peptidase n=1 Tax=Peribacillus alkalitolerans TaxID=1550385 RepID=UPI0013D50F77|nr:peptidoglycan endopeptidase [Peribacillus alkalitolerans]
MKKRATLFTAAIVLSATLVTPAFANTYTVKSGDTLSKVAVANSTTVANIKAWNKLTSDRLTINQKLIIAAPAKGTVTNVKPVYYTVVKGDTLSKIATKYKVSVAQLQSWNKLKRPAINLGQKLIVSDPTKNTASAVPNKPVPPKATPSSKDIIHIVKKDESLWKIATLYQTTVEQLYILNNLKSDALKLGQILIISKDGQATPATPVEPDKEDALIELAKKLVGIPYVWAGTSPAGFDCSGFIYYVYSNSGFSISRLSSYIYFDKAKEVDKPMPGDSVFFYTSSKNQVISHMGIYLGNDQFIHASSSKGVAINSLEESYYKTRFAGIKRIHK